MQEFLIAKKKKKAEKSPTESEVKLAPFSDSGA